MITISSSAGQRLARARASEVEAREHWIRFPNKDNHIVWQKTCRELDRAGDAVADELIAGKHHLVEGD